MRFAECSDLMNRKRNLGMTESQTATVPVARGTGGIELEFSMGSPVPLGATLQHGGVNFAIFSKHATAVTLVLFRDDAGQAVAEFPLNARSNRTGQIWHVWVRGIGTGMQYGYRMDCEDNPNPKIHRFDPAVVLLDPAAKTLLAGPSGDIRGKPPAHSGNLPTCEEAW